MSGDEQELEIDRRLGRAIRAGRLAAGLTQEALASSLGISYQQVQKYESGANRIGAARLVLLAERLGITVDGLLSAGTAGLPIERRAAEPCLPAAAGLAEIEDAQVRACLMALARTVAERQG